MTRREATEMPRERHDHRPVPLGNLRLKEEYRGFIWNSRRSLELMRPATAKLVTDHCPMMQTMLPLYIEGDHFTTPFCCYGNDVDCDRCGSWGVFAAAAKKSGPWDSTGP